MTQLEFNGLKDQAQRTVEYILNTFGAFELSQLHAGATLAAAVEGSD